MNSGFDEVDGDLSQLQIGLANNQVAEEAGREDVDGDLSRLQTGLMNGGRSSKSRLRGHPRSGWVHVRTAEELGRGVEDKMDAPGSMVKHHQKQQKELEFTVTQDEVHQRVLKRCLPSLIQDLDFDDTLDHIVAHEIFTDIQIRDMQELPTTTERNRALLYSLMKRNHDVYSVFLDCLSETLQFGLREKLEAVYADLQREITDKARKQTGSQKPSGESKEFTHLREVLLQIYTEKYSEIQISPMDDAATFPIDELYTQVSIVEEYKSHCRRGREKKKKKHVESYQKIFFKGVERLKTIFLLAPAGTGKTTWCYQVTNTWCRAHQVQTRQSNNIETPASLNQCNSSKEEDLSCMSKFPFLFFIPLRHADGKASILNAFLSTTLREYPSLHNTTRRVLEQHPEKVIIICDGLDEHEAEELSREALYGCTVLTTTRHWKYDVARSRMAGKPDLVLELEGLNKLGVEKLTKNVLEMLNMNQQEPEYKDSSESLSQCLDSIESAGLSDTVKIPLVLTYIVHLWHEKNKLPSSLTQIMIDLVICIVEKGEERLEQKGKKRLRQFVKKMEMRWRQNPLKERLADSEELQMYGGLLLSVAQLAFKGLTTVKKEESLVFKEKSLKQFFYNSPEEELEVCLNFGLLSQSKLSSALKKETMVTFYHKLVQEFFAAVWIVHSDVAFFELCKFCHDVNTVLDMGNVYMFVCGLHPALGYQLSKHVMQVCSCKPAAAAKSSRLLPTVVRDLTDTQLKCMEELKHSGTDAVKLVVSDIFVGGEFGKNHMDLIELTVDNLVYLRLYCITMTKSQWNLLSQNVNKCQCIKTVHFEDIFVEDGVGQNISENLEDTADEVENVQEVEDMPGVVSSGNEPRPHSALTRLKMSEVNAPLYPLLTCLKLASDLTHLCLGYMGLGWSLQHSAGCGPLLAEAIQHMPGLEELLLHHIDFSSTELVLSGQSFLKRLQLQGVIMSSEACSNLFHSIKTMECLSTLSLSLPGCDVEDDVLSTPSDLKQLELENVKFDMGELDLSHSRELKKLKLVDVRMSPYGWTQLFDCVKTLPALTEVRLKKVDAPDVSVNLPSSLKKSRGSNGETVYVQKL